MNKVNNQIMGNFDYSLSLRPILDVEKGGN